MEIITYYKKIENVSVVEVEPDTFNNNLPLIIFLHEFGCQKDTHLDEAKQIAKNGYRVLLPDAVFHGDHALAELENSNPLKKMEKIDSIYCQTAENIYKILMAEQLVRKNKGYGVGLLGISMGGCSVLHHIVDRKHPFVKAAVVIIASPYWANHLRQAVNELPELREFLSEQLINHVSKIEPAHFFKNVKDLPLMFQNGLSDKLVPIEDVRRGFKEYKANYKLKNRLELIEFENVGHECLPEMIDNAINWFNVHLASKSMP